MLLGTPLPLNPTIVFGVLEASVATVIFPYAGGPVDPVKLPKAVLAVAFNSANEIAGVVVGVPTAALKTGDNPVALTELTDPPPPPPPPENILK